ncbi:MAG: hypothetical protein IKN31_04135 [Bacteroidales bacterium]|nr:hypothetical protein [Bacteroidales bacterium]
MADLRTYRVADFFFTTEGIPNEPSNLQPFRVQEADGDILFSLEVVSELPEVPRTLLYKTPDEPGFPVIAIYTTEDGYYRIETQPLPGKPVAGEMQVDSDFTRARMELKSTQDRFAIDNSLMFLFAFSSACKNTLEMHSSVIVNDGKGYMFLGKSGTGKSTHTRLWLNHIPGSVLLNDDNPVIRVGDDGIARVYGSPWSGKTPCYKAMDAPIGAIVQLSQAPHNSIRRLNPIQAYATLMGSASSFRPLKKLADGWHSTMEILASGTAFYHLECLPDEAAAQLSFKTIHG